MRSKTFAVFVLYVLLSCKNNNSSLQAQINIAASANNENPYSDIAAIPLPAGFHRINFPFNSFGKWLEKVPLKKNKTVYLFDGTKKSNQSAQFAVLDIPRGNKDLQQCADAVMRLRAMYFFDQKKWDAIIFYDNEGTAYLFSSPYTQINFQHYLEKVFGICGSTSLSRQLKIISFSEVMPGDVLIRGGFPGHAEMVMDMAVNASGKKIFLLAQSYMPAQDIHILINPSNAGLSPWYEVNDKNIIETPEYTFRRNEWKRW